MAVYRLNRIGNRGMYMNCAVVDITDQSKSKRDTQAAATKGLSKYPELSIANLANINSCKTEETTDVIFGNPGKRVAFGNGDTPSNSGSGGSGQWTPPAQSKPQQGGDCATKIQDGYWHPECYGIPSWTTEQQQQPAQQQQPQQPKQDVPQPDAKKSNKMKPNTKVEQQLDAYLATLYGRGLARRNTVPAADYAENYDQKKEYSAQPHTHTHTKNCKHKTTGYPPGSHYHNQEDLDPYPEDGIDHSNNKRWTSYTKRAEGPRTPIQFHRGDESAYYQQQASTQASAQGSAQASTQASAQTSGGTPAQKSWNDVSDCEKFEAFLRRMVELSTNMASLTKYAAASTVNIPYYTPASTYASIAATNAEYAQKASKAFGDPLNVYSDKPETDPVPPESEPESETIPLVLGEPDIYNGLPDFPDFDVPDLDWNYTFPPQICATHSYIAAWLHRGDDSSSDEPSIIISIDPIDPIVGSDPDTSTFSCVEPTARNPTEGQTLKKEWKARYEKCMNDPTAFCIEPIGRFSQLQVQYEDCLKLEALDAIASP
ncbi:lytic polysaccharide monooxygenase [Macroventuria anomochaeta]|uniref:Lytic polysaccharide monooxygenase n=1 Tax=Macroventuria anomochaeta TaxID=301207 RepID=A0ACB6RKX9_9PLEO|nr:lytic polysaccharide monooxygenase [Macroventuria anomochaeta]KAF2622590.1 lytic polysaccharide monooxygenase [Macroventuria anomochaeta]